MAAEQQMHQLIAELLVGEAFTILIACIDRPEHEAPLTRATRVLMGGLSEAIVGWLDGSLVISRQMLVEECARLAVAVADAVQTTAGAS